MKKKIRIVIALGGNAIQNKGETGTHAQSLANVRSTMKEIAGIAGSKKYEVVITHGNGPQVGNLLIQNAAGEKQVPAMPLFLCDAMSQGEIGYWVEQSLGDFFDANRCPKHIITLLTQVAVKKNDPAFKKPSKPVGPFYTKEEAETLREKTGYEFKEDSGRGWRRVVASPEPMDIIERIAIRELAKNGNVVIAAGGGGIPVIAKGSRFEGIDAVIDKDKTGAVLGDLIDADVFVILTTVEKVLLNFRKENETPIERMNVASAKKYIKEGHFADGSMKPKIEAAITFIGNHKHRKVLITDPKHFRPAFEGKTGTWVVR
jgi:carbamate kinase